ncbi:MAG: hypothetical protein ACI9XJ_001855 [Marivirga sp.]|jgi:hypothetical protein
MIPIAKYTKYVLIGICVLLLPQTSLAQTDHWEGVIVPGDEFRFIMPSAELSTDWHTLTFDDSVWDLGASSIGYGDNDDLTVIAATASVYLRKTFTITDLSAIEELLFHMDYDDGFVAYLNGVEVARAFMTGNPPAFDQLSDDFHEALLYQGIVPEQFSIDIALLNEGQNILAMQVHNQAFNSSDLTALPVLSVGINNTTTDYSSVPDWFEAPLSFNSSNLPIIFINTIGGQAIPDEPKISADMQIIYRGAGERTFLSDKDDEQYIDFNSKIEIEIRGSSSQILPKKQYGFTTYDATGEDKDNVKLLGMPKENDWILNGLAFDPSLMRDYIAYNLSRRIGEYASRTQYCELVLNGTYNGLYVLQEKMKKDSDRIDITAVGDNEDGDISGGYITKSDKIDDNDPLAWSMPNYLGYETNFVHEEPKPDEVTSTQNEYIKGQFEKLQSATNASNASIIDGYPSIIDIPSFLNFIILNELASNVDGYEFSTYFHKDKNGKLRAGPLWDFNLTFGNDLFVWGFDRSFTDVWQFDNGDNQGAQFWKDLFDDADFKCYLSKRWNELTSEGQPLSINNVLSFIDETDLLISEATMREQQRWGTVENHAENIDSMKRWVTERIAWMSANMSSFSACSNVARPALVISKINYNPNSAEFGDIDEQEFIEITNVGSSTVDLTGIYFGSTGFVYQFPPNKSLAAGKRVLLANDSVIFKSKYNQSPYGEFTRSLSNGGEQLLLLDAFGNIIDEVFYDDKAPWPEAANGEGYFLQLNALGSDNSNPANWSAEVDSLEVLEEEILSIEGAKEKKLMVFPNPTKETSMLLSTQQMKTIRLIDLQGRTLLYKNINAYDYQLKTSLLDDGIYILQIDLADNTQLQYRIIKKD